MGKWAISSLILVARNNTKSENQNLWEMKWKKNKTDPFDLYGWRKHERMHFHCDLP